MGVLSRTAEGRGRWMCGQAAGAGACAAGVVRIPWRAFADHEAEQGMFWSFIYCYLFL